MSKFDEIRATYEAANRMSDNIMRNDVEFIRWLLSDIKYSLNEDTRKDNEISRLTAKIDELERHAVEIRLQSLEIKLQNKQLTSDRDHCKVRCEALIKQIAYCGACEFFGEPTPDGMGVCKKEPTCWKVVSPDDYNPLCFKWRDEARFGGERE